MRCRRRLRAAEGIVPGSGREGGAEVREVDDK